MQTATSTLTNAILASERMPLAKVEVDWDRDGYGGAGTIDDLSADVTSLTIDRSLATDLPPEVKLFTGYSVASATVVLARQPTQPLPTSVALGYSADLPYDVDLPYGGTTVTSPTAGPTQHTAWYYSPYNTASPLSGKRRKGAPVRLSLGFRGSAGPEYLVVLVGRIRSLQVSSSNREVTMEIGDLAETMRKQVTLPMIISDGENGTTAVRPGLNTTFLADWIARKCGYYASPPQRTSCQVSATLHGSGYPEKGSLQSFRGANLSRLAFSPTQGFPKSAPWVMAVNLNGTASQICSYVLANQSSVSTNNGDATFWEGWVRFDTIATGPAFMIAYKTGLSVPYVSLFVDSTGRLQSTFNRGGSDNTQRSTGTSGPSGIVANTWYYIAAYWAFTSTAVKVWLRVNGTTTGPISVTTPSVTNAPFINTLGIGRGVGASFADAYLDGLIADVQLTSENTGPDSPPSWNNACSPTAQIMPDENNLVATPAVADQAWTILQQIAAANFATAGFDETGFFRYLTRKRWSQAPYNTVQRILDSKTALKDLASMEAIDQVVNHWIVRALVPDVQDFGDVWSLATLVAVGSNRSKTIWADFDDPAANLDLTLTSHGSAGQSRYNASTARDGNGTVVSNLSFQVTAFAQSAKIVITNPNAFTVYLVGNSGVTGVTQGVPSMRLVGQAVRFNQDQLSTKMKSEAVDQGTPDNTVYTGAWASGLPSSFTDLNTFEADAGKACSIVHYFLHWGDTGGAQNFQTAAMNTIRSRGSIPMVTWEPWVAGGGATQPTYSLANIINGNFDAYITQFATDAAAWGHPFLLRFAHEMNGDWYPWSEVANGNSAGQYIQAWQHVYNIVHPIAPLASWVWCPMRVPGGVINPISSLYPGDAFVDWTGFDLYNFISGSFRSFAFKLGSTYTDLLALAPQKPIMIAEVGCTETGGDKAAWLTDALSQVLSTYPQIKAWVYFNAVGSADWRIETSAAAITAYAAGISSSRYLTNSFSSLSDAPIPTRLGGGSSIDLYGEQILELPDNPFRQDPDAIDGLAQELLAQTADPQPIMADIPIVGDVRLQLGDRCTLVDPDGLSLSRDFHLASIHTELTRDGGLGQTINVRSA